MKHTYETSIRGSCRVAGPGDWRNPCQSEASVGRPWRLVRLTQRSEEFVQRSVQRMGECVPGLERAEGSPLLNLDEGPSGQAASSRELVIAPALRRPQPRKLQTQRVEIRVGREDRHPTIRRCRLLPCQCRPLPYFR
jgi:hypothetical protein